MRWLLAGALVALSCVLVGCADSESVVRWTEREAESIRSVRSLPVNDAECRGLGKEDGGEHARFECTAGTRAPWETYDTIAVFYVLHPLGEYEGPRSRHRLTNVKFVGGPGVP
jgi:hypothetical protein